MSVEDIMILKPVHVLHIGNLVEVDATLLHGSANTESIMSIDVLAGEGDSGLAISVKGIEQLREPGSDGIIGRRTKEVEFTDGKEVVLLHLLIGSRSRSGFFVVQDRQEEVLLEVLVTIGSAPVASNAEGVLDGLGIEEGSSHTAGHAIKDPEAALAIVTTLHGSKRDELSDVVPVLHEHGTSNKTTLRVTNKDETILEQGRVLGNDTIESSRSVVNKSLHLLLAVVTIINIESKEGPLSKEERKTKRPILPKPLIPTLITMLNFYLFFVI